MTGAKQLPIAAAIAGLLAAIGITIKLAGTSEKTFEKPWEARVDDLLAREKELAVSDPFENLTSRTQEVFKVYAEYRELPRAKQEQARAKQEQVSNCLMVLRALSGFSAIEKQLDEIPDPKSARSRTQLSSIEFRLRQIEVPEKLPDVVKNGPVVQRHSEWLEDAAATEAVFLELAEVYRQLIDEAKTVLLNKNEPQLPERIQKVLASAKNLKTPENKDQLVPGSKRVRYSMVFQLAEIEKLVREWNKLKGTLEPAVKAKTP